MTTDGERWKVEGEWSDRRQFLASLAVASIASLLPSVVRGQQGATKAATKAPAQPALPQMIVYKSASCGCCKGWVQHVQKAGFTVRAVDTEELAAVKRDLGVPQRLQSCHTVVVGNYLVEGHVPADDVKRLLREKPAVRGLAVPGMPIGSPGMEQGDPKDYDRYEVLAFTKDGGTSVFAKH
jgi:hypothetical protein